MQCQTFTLRLDNAKDLEKLNRFLAQVMPIQVSSSLVMGNAPFWSVLVFYEGQARASAQPEPTALSKSAEPPSSPAFEALRRWRSQKAKEEGVPPYVIATNAELQAILDKRPQTLADLSAVKGFGQAKTGKYGQEILQLLSQVQ
ncbi:MAG: HRDC domain-containing protein [Meiothermus sp.]|uniref:HRDC domain-containing protein n=1 Tax=Meiothermus sp. TaxID=1955249 RepID=UPI0025EC02C4|nr:HRDC domain-containing protein [Meiothermus sp.]MCS7068784.1 HRDC domain-containing protein [Meiothermus sp.]MCX7601157.1 HRDC domain-containing protein [Meiothermus sp.]MDW8425076.1 HRDC domain-containing protein [Meiothermus sp.]